MDSRIFLRCHPLREVMERNKINMFIAASYCGCTPERLKRALVNHGKTPEDLLQKMSELQAEIELREAEAAKAAS